VGKVRADLRHRRLGPGNGYTDQIENTAHRLIEDCRGQYARIELADN